MFNDVITSTPEPNDDDNPRFSVVSRESSVKYIDGTAFYNALVKAGPVKIKPYPDAYRLSDPQANLTKADLSTKTPDPTHDRRDDFLLYSVGGTPTPLEIAEDEAAKAQADRILVAKTLAEAAKTLTELAEKLK